MPHRRYTTIVCNDTDYFLRHRRKIAETLCARGHDVTVITGGRLKQSHEKWDWAYRHVDIPRFDFHWLHDPALIWRTLRESRGRRLDGLLLITLKPAVFGGLGAVLSRRLWGFPHRVVITIAGLGRLMSPQAETRMPISRQLTEAALRWISKDHAVSFVFETEHDRSVWLERGLVQSARSTVVNGAGVDTGSFFPRSGDRSPGPLRVLFASRLLKAKGLDVFLRVAQALAPRGEIEFWVAGFAEASDTDSYLPEELARHTSIRFLGSIAEMPELLRSADIVCLPTRYGEGIPRILIEAAATGMPCIASGIDGCREIIEHDRTGFLVPVGDLEQTVTAVTEALDAYRRDTNLLKSHGAAAQRKFTAGSYDEASVITKFIALLEGAPEAL